jgi:hypothetical protein
LINKDHILSKKNITSQGEGALGFSWSLLIPAPSPSPAKPRLKVADAVSPKGRRLHCLLPPRLKVATRHHCLPWSPPSTEKRRLPLRNYDVSRTGRCRRLPIPGPPRRHPKARSRTSEMALTGSSTATTSASVRTPSNSHGFRPHSL